MPSRIGIQQEQTYHELQAARGALHALDEVEQALRLDMTAGEILAVIAHVIVEAEQRVKAAEQAFKDAHDPRVMYGFTTHSASGD